MNDWINPDDGYTGETDPRRKVDVERMHREVFDGLGFTDEWYREVTNERD